MKTGDIIVLRNTKVIMQRKNRSTESGWMHLEIDKWGKIDDFDVHDEYKFVDQSMSL